MDSQKKIIIKNKNKGEVETFSNKQELRRFITSRHALEEILKVVIQAEIKEHER